MRPPGHAFTDSKRVGVAGVEVHVKQTGHDLVVGVEWRPDRLALGEVLEEFGRKGAQVSSSDFLLADVETGDKLIAAAFEIGVSRTRRRQRSGRKDVASGEMASQLARGVFPTFIFGATCLPDAITFSNDQEAIEMVW